ncbi:MAG: 2,3-diaminopropionate biosynthesis protein SbnA [Legionellaceae bacterium]|nr:2,3-diaminopropionate biosynthesis protein SbnA [Legionellaceae bacterium]
MIYDSIENIIIDDVFFKARSYCNNIDVHIKLEGFNIPGSIKLKPAKFMIDEAEKAGTLTKGSKIIESSSGNLGVALSHICASRNYPFICVTDVKASEQNIRVMRALGSEVVIIDKLDSNFGYVEHRLNYINERLRADPNMVWLNQYANTQNTLSHFETTAQAILTEFDKIDYLFIGAGTTGTLMGCLKRFKIDSPHTTIVAVDATGSINFSDQPGKRYLAGLGSSRKPEILELDLVNETILIDEQDAIRHCKRLAKHYGILAGASTGTALAAVDKWSLRFKPEDTVVTISPDWGRSYLDTVYDEAWVKDTFGLIS